MNHRTVMNRYMLSLHNPLLLKALEDIQSVGYQKILKLKYETKREKFYEDRAMQWKEVLEKIREGVAVIQPLSDLISRAYRGYQYMGGYVKVVEDYNYWRVEIARNIDKAKSIWLAVMANAPLSTPTPRR